ETHNPSYPIVFQTKVIADYDKKFNLIKRIKHNYDSRAKIMTFSLRNIFLILTISFMVVLPMVYSPLIIQP
ncbi:hypothetical protein EGD29_17935, partial [Salmonella enterica]|nr:hypothetical protein [Salmonella enterica]